MGIIKTWEVSLMEFEDDSGKIYKVTRRYPEYSVSETKVFKSKEDAVKLFKRWLE